MLRPRKKYTIYDLQQLKGQRCLTHIHVKSPEEAAAADAAGVDIMSCSFDSPEAQARLPNRHGMQTRHALWPGPEFGGTTQPDTANVACMRNCSGQPRLSSSLPDAARNAYGNLQEQNRSVGPQRGLDSSKSGPTRTPARPLRE